MSNLSVKEVKNQKIEKKVNEDIEIEEQPDKKFYFSSYERINKLLKVKQNNKNIIRSIA